MKKESAPPPPQLNTRSDNPAANAQREASIRGVQEGIAQKSDNFLANCAAAARQKFKASGDPQKYDFISEQARRRYLNPATNMMEFPCQLAHLSTLIMNCTDRKIREAFCKRYTEQRPATVQSEYGGAWKNFPDNYHLATQLLSARKYLAQLLGYENYIDYAFADKVIDSPAAIDKFLEKSLAVLQPVYRENFRKTERFARAQLNLAPLQPWDYSYVVANYSARITKTKPWELIDYFELERVKQFSFDYFEKMFGLKFVRTTADNCDEAYLVHDRQQKKNLALLKLDLFDDPRREKCHNNTAAYVRIKYRGKDTTLPELSLGAQFSKNPADGKCLLGFSDLVVYFHEMGHVLEASFTGQNIQENPDYPIEMDMIEFYSQFTQNFVYDWEFMREMSSHHLTGKKMPRTVFNDALKHKKFTESSNIMDTLLLAFKEIKLNLQPSVLNVPGSVAELDQKVFGTQRGVIHNVFYESSPNLFHWLPGALNDKCNFYSYLVAEVAAREVFDKFKGKNSLATPQADTRLRDTIFAARGRIPFATAYKEFTGKEIFALNARKYNAALREPSLIDKFWGR